MPTLLSEKQENIMKNLPTATKSILSIQECKRLHDMMHHTHERCKAGILQIQWLQWTASHSLDTPIPSNTALTVGTQQPAFGTPFFTHVQKSKDSQAPST
jgi:hypothetical protein